MKDLDIITNNMNIKDAFGSFKILDEVDPIDHPQIYKFATIVCNYLKMNRLNDEKN